MNILGENLKDLRLARKQNQAQVAESLGVPSPTYSSWERGRTEPNIEWLLKLAHYYDVSVDRLLRSDVALKIGSWLPLGEDPTFHPLKYEIGFYTLIYPLVFNRLFFFDIYERRFHIELIDSWRTDRSDSSYTFYLRRGIKFHSGEPLELEDVKYSYEEFLRHYDFYKRFIDAIEVERQENAIKLKLKRNRWLELHNLPAPYIIPRAYEDDDQCLEGTGPFRLTREYQDKLRDGFEQPLVLESNNEYFGKMPSIGTVKFYKYNSVDELGDSLTRGEVNFAVDLAWDKSGGFGVIYGFGNISFYLVLKQDNQICQDASFTQAVDLALDRSRIIDNMVALMGIEDAQFLPSRHLYNLLQETLSGSGEDNYDPDKARECWQEAKASLSESGVKDLTLRIAPVTKNHAVESRLVDEVIEHLQEIGIDARREEGDEAHKAHVVAGAIKFDTPEFAHQILYSRESEKRIVPLWGWSYKNSYVDNLLDNVEGMETYRKVQEVLSAEHIFIPLFRRGIAVTHTKDLDTKSKLRVTNLLYGPDVVHWEFK
jgi:ABC-type transport system substrate-binding protein